eukprot:TRINITY_DN15124_c0_g2_i2.p2 TRINITY_DN15124_c0_g2~~TRINITY_DN15124_c0_g2_i2.p2  ORF type:complete len:104 (+),score=14.52 TRINITY_DN15124_c0_g2_i2:75-386(+)
MGVGRGRSRRDVLFRRRNRWYLDCCWFSDLVAGAFGIVYKGIHNVTSEIAAVKITKTEGEDEISDYIELTVLRKCNHPNIIKYMGCWRKGPETFVGILGRLTY